MAKHEDEYTGSSFWQLMLVIPGTIIGFTLIISILAYFLNSGSGTEAAVEAAPVAAAAAVEVEKNVEPVAEVEVAAAVEAGSANGKTGEEVVKNGCAMCHATGMMESPKIGDASQWGPRIEQGYETLVHNAINGIRNMPAKGGNASLTDVEIARAVAYMANQAGAEFDPESL